MTPGWWAAALVAVAAPAANDAPAAVPSLTAWHGEWAGEGTAFGKPAAATLVIGPAEDGATALAYRLSVAGQPSIAYSAKAVYRVDGKGRVSGSWTDSTGRMRPVGGRLSVPLWTSNWGSADVEIGRSTYRLEGENLLAVSDSVLQDDGSWRVFPCCAIAATKAENCRFWSVSMLRTKKEGRDLHPGPAFQALPS